MRTCMRLQCIQPCSCYPNMRIVSFFKIVLLALLRFVFLVALVLVLFSLNCFAIAFALLVVPLLC